MGANDSTAALAFVEKNKKALARFGMNIAVSPRPANPSMRIFWLKLMETRGKDGWAGHTKMAYIHDISHLFHTILTFDTFSISEQDTESTILFDVGG